MPATRSQLRLPSPHHDEPKRDSQLETLDTVSTAVLPPSYTVTVASTSPLLKEEKGRLYTKAQECLHDAVRRVRDKERDLADLVRARKRRRIHPGADAVKLDRGVLWYTASLRYPCSCDLEPLSNAFTLRVPPPAAGDLPPLPAPADRAEIVRLGEELDEWDSGQAGYTDLDPDLSQLNEFESEWKRTTGSIWRQSQGHGRCWDALEGEDADQSFEAVKESLATRRIRKGKYKAVDRSVDLAPPDVSVLTVDLPRRARISQIESVDHYDLPKERWEEEARRRKQLWRGLIGKDPGYGQFWHCLARPRTYPNIGALPGQARPPDYNLFRKYRTASHPFHPDLYHYAKKNRHGRIYWMIPIHGPVIVPTVNDDAHSATMRPGVDVPLPSAGTFSKRPPGTQTSKAAKSATVHWSPALLNHFVTSFLLPLRLSRLYALSVTFSGPKPDPFIDLPSPHPLASHAHLPRPLHIASDSSPPPVRPEVGDHLRLYCDAGEALSLRTWLNGVAIDPNAVGSGDAVREAKSYKLFEKVRLCLIGERGEVLIVA